MSNKLFTLKFEKEQPFSFFEKYAGPFKDDEGRHVVIDCCKAVLFQTSFQMSNGTDHNQYPWTYTFEIVR